MILAGADEAVMGGAMDGDDSVGKGAFDMGRTRLRLR